jgi:DeoR/GlpR family transcriptional regulator of sugar metabolism
VAENFDLKEAIGREAAGEIRAGEVVLINDGSTCFHLASHMEAGRKVTVYTNSIAMIPELARAGVRVFVIGGEYSRDLCCLGGSLLQNSLETLRFDAAFLGADAVDEKGNCRVNDPETARVTRMMLRCARRSILLADHTKAAAGAHAAYAPVSAFDLWITTRGMPPALLRRFSKMTSVREVAP